jgi:hypothetical protein
MGFNARIRRLSDYFEAEETRTFATAGELMAFLRKGAEGTMGWVIRFDDEGTAELYLYDVDGALPAASHA